MKNYNTFSTGSATFSAGRGVRYAFFLLVIALALGVGLAFAAPARAAGLAPATLASVPHESSSGDITGSITMIGGNAAGLSVELRQRSNGGEDRLLASATTDDKGVFHFMKQQSAPGDAFYYIKVAGRAGTLSAWYSFPIIYLAGQDFTVPSIEMSDVQLLVPDGATISLPGKLVWKARRAGETHRVFVYAAGSGENAGKAVLDSGSLGMNTEFALPDGSLPDGAYEAVVQVRDAVVGYGQSQNRFRFTVSKAGAGANSAPAPGGGGQAPAPAPTVQTTQPQPAAPTDTPVPPAPAPQATPADATETSGEVTLDVKLSGDKTEVGDGETLIYKMEVSNSGDGLATGVSVVNKMPAGVTVAPATAKGSQGTIFFESNKVTVQLGDIAPGGKASVELPVIVSKEAGTSISNQVTAQYQGAPAPVVSNAYVVQVAQPAESPNAQAVETPTLEPAATTAPAETAVAPATVAPVAPAPTEAAAQPAPPAAAPTETTSAQPAPPAPAPAQPTAAANTGSGGTAGTGTTSGGSGGSGSQATPTPKKPPSTSSMPQTGGAFPVVFALVLVFVTLLARYLRGRTYRRI